MNAQGEVIEGLKDAVITIQKDGVILDNLPIGTTDVAGEALLQNLSIGHYSYTAKATGHTTKAGAFWVYPGITSTQAVHLDSQLISVEWSVVPTTIKDKYDIVLNTTFATSVPAAVVTVEPAAINLPDNMKAGQVYPGEFKFTNHGLIRADKVQFTLPPPDSLFKFETLGTVPDKIEAGQTVYLPYRITCVNPASLSDGSGGGTEGGTGGTGSGSAEDPFVDDGSIDWSTYTGPCKHVLRICTLTYAMRCTNLIDVTLPPVTVASYARYGRNCDSPPSSGGGFNLPSFDLTSGTHTSSTTTYIPGYNGPTQFITPSPAQNGEGGDSGLPPCQTVLISSECHEIDGDSLVDLIGCGVNRVTGNYTDGTTSADELLDMQTETFGYTVSIQRSWNKGLWRFEHDKKNLSFITKLSPSGQIIITDIISNSVKYSAPEAFLQDSSSAVEIVDLKDAKLKTHWSCPDGYRSGNSTFRFNPTQNQWQYRNATTSKQWFDPQGRCLGYGAGSKIIAVYERDSNGYLTAIKNRRGVTLFTLINDATGHILSAKDRDNREVHYTWDLNKLLTYSSPAGEITRFEYDSNGRITRKITPAGVITSVSYYSDGRVSKVVEGDTTHTYSWSYDAAKALISCSIKDTDSGIEEVWFTQQGLVVKSAFNGKIVYQLDRGDRESVVTNAQGLKTTCKFDEFNNLIETKRPDGTLEKFEHGVEASQLKAETSITGLQARYEYDGNYNLTKEIIGEGTPFQQETLYEYDADDQLIKTTQRAPGLSDRVSSTTYDDDGHVLTETDEEGRVTSVLARNSLGQELQIKDPSGLITTNEYDVNGRLIKTTDGLGRVQTTVWSPDSLPTRVIDPKGKSKTIAFSSRRLPTSMTDRRGGQTQISYSPEQQPLKITHLDGSIQNFEYDNMGRLIVTQDGERSTRITYSDKVGDDPLKPVKVTSGERVVSFTYDAQGRLVKTAVGTEAEPEKIWTRQIWNDIGMIVGKEESTGQTLRFQYDQMFRLTATWFRPAANQPEERISASEYNAYGELLASTDAAGKKTLYHYSPSGRLLSLTTPEGRTLAYSRQSLQNGGEIDAVTYPKGNKRVTTSDAQGRVSNVSIFAAGATQAESSWSYEYDELDQVTAIKDANGQVLKSFTYDEEGAVTSAASRIGSQLFTESYSYASSGRLQSMTRVDGAIVTFGYDDEGRLTSLSNPTLGLISFSDFYGHDARRFGFPGGSSLSRTFDAAGHLSRLLALDPAGASLLDRNLTYDIRGNLVAVTTPQDAAAYTYDQRHQLTAWQRGSQGESFLLDVKGNRLGQAPFGTTPQAQSVFDGDDKLISSPGASYEYDANGNLTRLVRDGRDLSFVYNAADQLVEVREGNQFKAIYTYDCEGRRDSKQTAAGTQRFLYDGNARLIAELDDSSVFHRVYTWYGSTPIAFEEAGSVRFLLCDERNAPVKAFTSSGQVLWQAVYSPFGAALTNGNIDLNLRLPGQYYDAETGLHYNMARYYDPELGRYTQPDPIMADANAFSYAGHNPFSRFDPFGTNIVQNLSNAEAIDLIAALGSILPNPAGWAADAAGILAGIAQGDVGGVLTSVLGAIPVLGDAASAAKLGMLLNKFQKKLPLRNCGTGKCSNSFSPETEVLLADGSWKKLKDFNGSETLLGNNPDTPSGARTCKVEAVIDGNTYEFYDIGLDTNGDGLADGNSVKSTPLHPFFTRRGWVYARDLKLGDEVKTDKELFLPVRKHEKLSGYSPCYNLSVETEHCYFVKVAGQAVVVHNARRSEPISNNHGGGKNGKHCSLGTRNAAREQWLHYKQLYEEAVRRQAPNSEKILIDKQIKHWKLKMDCTGENHSQNSKGCR